MPCLLSLEMLLSFTLPFWWLFWHISQRILILIVPQFLFLETDLLSIVAQGYVFDSLMLLNETLHVTLIKVYV